MKKFFSLLVMLVAVGGFTLGCGETPPANPPADETTPAETETPAEGETATDPASPAAPDDGSAEAGS